jgi:hypothetical protein
MGLVEEVFGVGFAVGRGRTRNEDWEEKSRARETGLQGGGGNFGAVTEFKVRAVKSPAKIYSGQVFYSFDQV